jgi:predicted nucleic acid-binding protein
MLPGKIFDARPRHQHRDLFFKGMGNVASRLFSLPSHEIALPALVLYELQVGIAKSSSELVNFSKTRRPRLQKLVGVADHPRTL